MDWLFRQITEQWAVVMNAPAILLSVLLVGVFVGWGAARAILRERLEQQRKLLEAYKQRLDDRVIFPKKTKQPASVVAKKLRGFWEDGITLSRRAVRTQDDKARWFNDVTEWKDATAGYLKSVGLGEESSMFETIQIEPTPKKFPTALDVEHNGSLQELEQRMRMLRRVLARAEQRASE